MVRERKRERFEKGCSVSGIWLWDRKRHFASPKKSVQLPQMTIADHHRVHHATKFNPSFAINPRCFRIFVAALCNVREDETINEFITLE